MTLEEENAHLLAENQALHEALEQTQELLGVALARIKEVFELNNRQLQDRLNKLIAVIQRRKMGKFADEKLKPKIVCTV